MDTAKLWFTLLWVYTVWSLTLARDCDWMSQYRNGEICCQGCPSGEYPIKLCSKNNDKSVCEKCPGDSGSVKCFCNDSLLCSDDKCSSCVARPTCLPGFQMIRVGDFDYTYYCEPCPNGTYKGDEDEICKSFVKCDGLRMIFAGNRTHNARCACYDYANVKKPSKEQPNDNFYYIMMSCLIVAVFLCLLVVMVTAFLIFKCRRHRTLFKQCTHKVVLPSDGCNCKLSKEEMGDDETDSKTTLEFSLKCESLIP